MNVVVKRCALLGVVMCVGAMALPASPSGSEFVDRIIAAVNNDVITYTDLQHALAFNEAVSGPFRDKESALRETLEGLINRRLLVQEAARFGFPWPDEQDVQKEIDAVKNRIGVQAFADFLKRAVMSEQELRRMLAERLLVEGFLEKRVAVFVRVRREEAEAYFQSHAKQFEGRNFNEVYRSIMSALSEQKKEGQIGRFLAELKAKADIRVNL